VIAGASSAQQVRANVSAAGWSVGTAELEEIDALLSREVGNATA
jgi:aryl-alcohol dehydrogenase-like predicted oxidoreductase